MLLCEMCEGGRVVWLYLISSTAPYRSDLSLSFSSSVRAIVSYTIQRTREMKAGETSGYKHMD